MGNYYLTQAEQERVVLVGIENKQQNNKELAENLKELSFLTETAGAKPVKIFTQKLETPNPNYFVGSGKLQELIEYVKNEEIDIVIFDDELTPTQLRNIEKAIGCKILDRTNLILDIFAKRAQTAHAKVQVELAQYQYILPRLTKMWTHLSRQKGGIGLRGPGEREIETDRRIIRNKISNLKKRLEKIDKQKTSQRKNRGNLVRVALVGYTNVGKSTIMNLLSKSEVFAENKLFATLDTTVRKVVIDNLPFLLSDTVGFIKKLPHDLIESFKSTLDEVREADILLHVADISHPNFEEQLNIVNQTLKDIGVENKPVYLIFNKIDAFTYEKKDDDDLTPKTKINYSLNELMNSWMGKENSSCLFISAMKKTNITNLKKLIYKHARIIHAERFPYHNFLY